MKLLTLRFKNLNSLYGEWNIDFQHPEFQSQGIFAITGPTGAGKSTLLDAICLALYGRTPRLKVISKNSNEIMSRQSGECFAEVTFSSNDGIYRCHWSQIRARRKSDGALQESKHEIADVKTGQIIESKKKDVARVIEDVTGMDFDRFTRSVLLAQGSFAAFLQATADERSPILEQITGTEIYSDISKKVHERQRLESDKLTLLKAEISGMNLLSDDEESQLQAQSIEREQSLELLRKENLKTTAAIQWLESINTISIELQQFEQKLIHINGEIEQFSPSQQKLDSALKAFEIEGHYVELKALRTQQQQKSDQLVKFSEILPNQLAQKQLQQQLVTENGNNIVQAKTLYTEQKPIINQARKLDVMIVNEQSNIDNTNSEITRINAEIGTIQKRYSDNVTKKQAILNQSSEIQDYLDKNQQDGILISQFAGIKEQINTIMLLDDEILSASNAIVLKEKHLATLSFLLEQQRASLNQETQQSNTQLKKLTDTKSELSQLLGTKLLREYRTDRDVLNKELILVNTIIRLEDERKKLIAGNPCPLCGATDHPYAQGNIPELNEIEQKIEALNQKIKQAEQYEELIQQLQSDLNMFNDKKGQIEAKIAELSATNRAEQAYISLQKDELQQKQQRKQTINESLTKLLEPWKLELVSTSLLVIIEKLATKLKDWQHNQAKLEQIESMIKPLDDELIHLTGICQQLAIQLKAQQYKVEGYLAQYQQYIQQRLALYGEKSPDEEEQKLTASITTLEQQEKLLITQYQTTKEQCDNTETQIKTLNQSIKQRSLALTHIEIEFNHLLNKQGFIDENDFLNKRLSTDDRNSLLTTSQTLSNKKIQIITNIEDRTSRLKIKQNKQITDQPLDLLLQKNQQLTIQINQLAEDLGSIKQQLETNKKTINQIKEKQNQITLQSKEYERWQQLHRLIGSADGKKYRNFAQGLTFEFLMAHANKQLTKMTDRYLLIRNKEQPLDLDVIDNYQAGEIRSTKNLSGGESFIVSLALALGLSKISSQKIRIDSLFLDEGFGTLDEEALDTALETLSSLQQEGKLIGVISHVGALKERISLQLEVTPLSGGKSNLSGVGCSS